MRWRIFTNAIASTGIHYLRKPPRGVAILDELAAALLQRAARRVRTAAAAALRGGDVDGAYVAAYDAYFDSPVLTSVASPLRPLSTVLAGAD
jgi:hypothetical protein